jgi:D-arabinose 1-dehydrogenase-like Zn-dependent alcohol dehydrogenase
MNAMVLKGTFSLAENPSPLEMREILIKILACGVCHTALLELKNRKIRGAKVPVCQ